MSQAKHGHSAGAFATQQRAWLLAKARNMCRGTTDAEDLVQETLLRFIQTFERAESLPSERTCAAWLVTTLTNLFYMQCRKLKVQAQSARDPLLSEEAVVEPELPAPKAGDTITNEQFAQALQKLSPKVRTTFEMHAAGKKYQDIAHTLGVPVGTVAKRLYDARAKLREFLQSSFSSWVN
ncbi:MAG TPA: RNA polymerase sigma factor [Hyalangium sp.]|nr:RNA polymerase sigma factor [Hyalangium sp.]